MPKTPPKTNSVVWFGEPEKVRRGMASTPAMIINKHLPKARTVQQVVNQVMKTLAAEKISPTNSILAVSTCSDEICRHSPDFESLWGNICFYLGGLAGYPFAGPAGFGAFSHHIGPGGNLVIFFGSHIGVSNSGALGKVNRAADPEHESTACGALVGAYNLLKERRDIELSDSDFQLRFVLNHLRPHMDKLEGMQFPILGATNIMYSVIEKEIRNLAASHEGKVALIGGLQINSPNRTADMFELRTFEILDSKTKQPKCLPMDQ